MKTIYQFVLLFMCVGFIAAASQKCIKCSSAHDGQDCINTNGTVLSRRCDRPDGCFTRVVDGQVHRGCTEEVDQNVLRNCGDDTNCLVCKDDDCNAGLFPSKRIFCHKCDDATECRIKREGTPLPCIRYKQDDECIVRKKGNHVIRQCLSDYEDCSKEDNCKKCNFHGCNLDEFNNAISLKNSFIFVLITCLMTRLF